MCKKTIIFFIAIFLAFSSVQFANAENDQKSQTSQESDKKIENDFQKLLDEAKQVAPTQNSSLKDDVKIEVIKQPSQISQSQSQSPPTYPRTIKEILVISGVGLIFLILNFIGSIFAPKLRYLFIGVPFDLGVKEVKSEAQNAVKRKRILIELFLLILYVLIFILILLGDKTKAEENLLDTLIGSLFTTSILYLLYISVRLIWGFKSKCPSCKNMFSKKVISKYDQPSSTYTKYSKDSPPVAFHYEIGITVCENLCNVCGHKWTTRNRYEKRI